MNTVFKPDFFQPAEEDIASEALSPASLYEGLSPPCLLFIQDNS
jgi:hypothetical protein